MGLVHALARVSLNIWSLIWVSLTLLAFGCDYTTRPLSFVGLSAPDGPRYAPSDGDFLIKPSTGARANDLLSVEVGEGDARRTVALLWALDDGDPQRVAVLWSDLGPPVIGAERVIPLRDAADPRARVASPYNAPTGWYWVLANHPPADGQVRGLDSLFSGMVWVDAAGAAHPLPYDTPPDGTRWIPATRPEPTRPPLRVIVQASGDIAGALDAARGPLPLPLDLEARPSAPSLNYDAALRTLTEAGADAVIQCDASPQCLLIASPDASPVTALGGQTIGYLEPFIDPMRIDRAALAPTLLLLAALQRPRLGVSAWLYHRLRASGAMTRASGPTVTDWRAFELMAAAGFPEHAHAQINRVRHERDNDFTGYRAWEGPVLLDATIAHQRAYLFSADDWRPLPPLMALDDPSPRYAARLNLPDASARSARARAQLAAALRASLTHDLTRAQRGDWTDDLTGLWRLNAGGYTMPTRFTPTDTGPQGVYQDREWFFGGLGTLSDFEATGPRQAQMRWRDSSGTGWLTLTLSDDGRSLQGTLGWDSTQWTRPLQGHRIDALLAETP